MKHFIRFKVGPGANLHASIRKLCLASLISVSVAACQSIPDVSGWNQATKDVTGAVTMGFNNAANVNGDVARRIGETPAFADQANRYLEVAKALTTRANDYEKLFGAISDYSGSLASIARAAENSQKTVDSVAGSVNQLVGALGGTSLAGGGFELGKVIVVEVIKIKAAHDFADAVQKADPVIGQIAELLVKDLSDLQRAVSITKDEVIREAIEKPNESRLKYRSALERRRTLLQATVAAAITPPQTGSLLNSDAGIELARVEQSLRDADAWYKPVRDDLDHSLQVRAKSEELVIQTGRAVQAWRASHASVAAAVKERRIPETGRLVALALKIRDLASELKKEK